MFSADLTGYSAITEYPVAEYPVFGEKTQYPANLLSGVSLGLYVYILNKKDL